MKSWPRRAPGDAGAAHDGPGGFRPATSPDQPDLTTCELVEVKGALLTPLRRGPLATSVAPHHWISGAVHDAEGRLVPASQRFWAGDDRHAVAADPEWIPVPKKPVELSGSWLYVGHWFPHFGHFLLETLTNLWPDPAATDVDGLLAHNNFRGSGGPASKGPALASPQLKPWHREFLRLAGYGDREVRVARRRVIRVEHLFVPRRPVVLKSWALPPAVDVWRRVAAAVEPGTDERVFLSRKLFHEAKAGRPRRVRVTEDWDDRLERMFGEAGFRIVHPETLPIAEQVGLASGASVIAGSSGSALHLSAFAAPGTKVLEVGDSRFELEPAPAQRMVDAACGHVTAFVRYRDTAALHQVLATL